MPKDWFKLSNMTSINEVPKGGKIHLIGVAGVAMGQLAVALKESGFDVSGSDKEFYEPMGSFLKNSKVKLCPAYDAANVPDDVDLVIIGNAISYGHPEVDVIEQRNLPYNCFPRALQEVVIGNRHSIVVTGTHGKSTTTAMTASILNKLNKQPSFFIGAVSPEFSRSLNVGAGTASVVEGDEYDDVFFSKKAKFTHYTPRTAIINAIEFDHADLYPSLDSMIKAFDELVTLLPDDGLGICCIDFENVRELVGRWSQLTKARCVTFGEHPDSDYRISNWQQEGSFQSFEVISKTQNLNFRVPLIGVYNARNALAASLACIEVGCSADSVVTAVGEYQAVKRRQQVHIANDQITLIEDFAHHPTAVAATIKAIKSAFPTKQLWAVFEPRSNTSRRKVFETDYISAFKMADHAILAEVQARAIDSGQELLDVHELADNITSAGTKCECLPDAQAIYDYISQNLAENSVVLVMSNGSFGNLIQLLNQKYQE